MAPHVRGAKHGTVTTAMYAHHGDVHVICSLQGAQYDNQRCTLPPKVAPRPPRTNVSTCIHCTCVCLCVCVFACVCVCVCVYVFVCVFVCYSSTHAQQMHKRFDVCTHKPVIRNIVFVHKTF